MTLSTIYFIISVSLFAVALLLSAGYYLHTGDKSHLKRSTRTAVATLLATLGGVVVLAAVFTLFRRA